MKAWAPFLASLRKKTSPLKKQSAFVLWRQKHPEKVRDTEGLGIGVRNKLDSQTYAKQPASVRKEFDDKADVAHEAEMREWRTGKGAHANNAEAQAA